MPSSTPIYGFPYPLGTDPVGQGAQDIEDLATAVENYLDIYQGLVKVVPTGAVNGTVLSNGDVQVGTMVSYVSVIGAFSASYNNYIIQIAGLSVTSNGVLNFNFEDSTGTIVNSGLYVMNGFYQLNTSGGMVTVTGNAFTYWEGFSVTTTSPNHGTMTINGPFLPQYTSGMHEGIANDYRRSYGLLHRSSTSYTRFRLSKANMAGGAIRIYGYNQ